MARKQGVSGKRSRDMIRRTSISVPADQYAALEEIAERLDRSLAWVVRDAVKRYITTESAEHPQATEPQSGGRSDPRR